VATVLIIGASRGIGLETVRAKAADAKSVAKTQRKSYTPVEAEGTVNDAGRHGAIERWKPIAASWRRM
jgi:NAD(P)-dependent dehydrogenase (short-subunit alcohol dehydrogenase family)